MISAGTCSYPLVSLPQSQEVPVRAVSWLGILSHRPAGLLLKDTLCTQQPKNWPSLPTGQQSPRTSRILKLAIRPRSPTRRPQFSSVQFSSVTQSCLTLCDPMNRSTPGLPVHHHLPEFTQTHVHRVSDAIQPSHPLPFPSPSALPASVFSNESTLLMRWPKYWSFSFNIIPSKEIPGLISFRMDWLDLAVQGTLKSLLQHHSSKASVLWCSAFSPSNSHIQT